MVSSDYFEGNMNIVLNSMSTIGTIHTCVRSTAQLKLAVVVCCSTIIYMYLGIHTTKQTKNIERRI